MSLPVINLSTPAVSTWRSFSTKERQYFRDYFDLKTVKQTDIKAFPFYKHDYKYGLSNVQISQVIFCAVVETIRYNLANNMKIAIFGNSGGLDSATVCALMSKTVKLSRDLKKPLSVLSLGLPIQSNPDHGRRSSNTASHFGIDHVEIEGLDDVFKALLTSVSPISDHLKFNEEQLKRANGNIKARMRMIVNFYASTRPGSYVLSTDNLSELYLAFWTLMGDVGAFGPIQNILKGLELPYISLSLGVPEETLIAKPTDGLNIHTSLDNQEGGDSDAFFGLTYPHIDAIICHAVNRGLTLDKPSNIQLQKTILEDSTVTQKTIDSVLTQMSSALSIWKRTHGSIGISIQRRLLGLPSLKYISKKI